MSNDPFKRVVVSSETAATFPAASPAEPVIAPSAAALGDSHSSPIPKDLADPTYEREARPDEMFCQSCGNIIKKEAALCVKCGVPTRRTSVLGTGAKSKTASVLLAVFLSFWTWCYTYREDKTKFLFALGVSIGNFLLVFLTLGFWALGPFWLVLTGIWIWAIVDVAVKDARWYEAY